MVRDFSGGRSLGRMIAVRCGALLVVCSLSSAALAAAGAVMLQEPSLPNHVVYRPADLAPFGGASKLPVVVWANGGCSNRGNSAEPFLSAIAAHGYLVIASGTVRPAPPAPAGANPPHVPPDPRTMTTTPVLLDAIAWATRQDSEPGGEYAGKIAAGRIAAMGTSCGGLQAIEIGPDPRVATVAVWSSGLLDQPRPGAGATRQDLQKLHGPILYVVGGTTDGAVPHAEKDFSEITRVPAVLAENATAGHGTPITQPDGGQWAPVAIAWLDWHLRGDRRGASMFQGARCGLCTRADWKVQSRQP